MSSIRRVYSGLIRKDEVGRPKSALYELPNPDFVYGLPSGENIEGAKEGKMICSKCIKRHSDYKLEDSQSKPQSLS